MNDPWVTLMTFSLVPEAYIVKGKLESEGIECQIVDENIVGITMMYSNAVGGIKLQVPQSALVQARALLAPEEPRKEAGILVSLNLEGQPSPCSSCGSPESAPSLWRKWFPCFYRHRRCDQCGALLGQTKKL